MQKTTGGRRVETGPREILKLLSLKGLLSRHWLHGAKCEKCGHFNLINKTAGWPDVDVFMPGGRLLMIEWKGGQGRNAATSLSTKQKIRIQQLRDLGFEVLVTNNYEDLNEL